jgi:hypothetical protein
MHFKKGLFMTQANAAQNIDDVVVQILKAIQALRFGSIEITVHEGRVTQIEKREKLRISSANQKIEGSI